MYITSHKTAKGKNLAFCYPLTNYANTGYCATDCNIPWRLGKESRTGDNS
ncbi:protein of unknown function [Georgfuchsia toluolica]|uniref:Uncharacterized protein n=1 Tax=Georgfuchsia toluolica TaxID=424218 RepID=A0A916IZY1_9PROT|nr:protein of unknown function [Georgfuchsia toluolica]